MKTPHKGILKIALAIGKLIARVASESVKDVIVFFRRRRREIEWPDTGTASTIW